MFVKTLKISLGLSPSGCDQAVSHFSLFAAQILRNFCCFGFNSWRFFSAQEVFYFWCELFVVFQSNFNSKNDRADDQRNQPSLKSDQQMFHRQNLRSDFVQFQVFTGCQIHHHFDDWFAKRGLNKLNLYAANKILALSCKTKSDETPLQ